MFDLSLIPKLCDAIRADFQATGTVSHGHLLDLAGHVAPDHPALAAPTVTAPAPNKIDWAQLFSVLLPIILQILGGLFPAPKPTP